MRNALLRLAGPALALCLGACFDADNSDEAAAPTPAAPSTAPAAASVMEAPGLARKQAAANGTGGNAGSARGGPGAETLGAADVDFRVTNPASGAALAVYAELPASPPPYRAVVVVPGGVQDASGVFHRAVIRQPILDAGVAIFRFDPDGRGQSDGQEDLGGARHQAGLQAVIQQVIARDDVIDDQVGVFSNSMGIQMASGALAGGKTGARFLIDWEGPSSRVYTAGCGGKEGITLPQWAQELDCSDDAYWAEREAEGLMRQLTIPYQRIQRAHDHVHDTDAGHAVALYRAALEGPSPWARFNTLDPNAAVSRVENAQRPDVGYPTLVSWYSDYIQDMFTVIDGGEPPAHDHVMSDGKGGPRQDGGRKQGGQGGGKGAKRGRPGKR